MSHPQPVATFTIHDDNFSSVCFVSEEPYYNFLFAGSQSGTVYIYNLHEVRQVRTQRVADAPIMTILHYAKTKVVLQSKSGVYTYWAFDPSRACELTLISVFESFASICRCVLCLDVSLIVPYEKSKLAAVSLETSFVLGKYLCQASFEVGEVMSARVVTLSDEMYILAGHESGHMFLYKYSNGEVITWIALKVCIFDIDFDPSTKRIAVASSSQHIKILEFTNNNSMELKAEYNLLSKGSNSLKIRDVGPIMIVGGWDGRVTVVSWKSFITLAILTLHTKGIAEIACSEGIVVPWISAIIAVAGSEGVISLWNLYGRNSSTTS